MDSLNYFYLVKNFDCLGFQGNEFQVKIQVEVSEVQ